MCLPFGGLTDLECLSVDNTSWGGQMLGSCCPSMYLLAVFPLCPFLVSGGLSLDSRSTNRDSTLGTSQNMVTLSVFPSLKHKPFGSILVGYLLTFLLLLKIKFDEECYSLYISPYGKPSRETEHQLTEPTQQYSRPWGCEDKSQPHCIYCLSFPIENTRDAPF